MAKSKRTLEQVHYDLDLLLASDRIKLTIYEAILPLPEEIYDYILENIQFESAINSMMPRECFKKKYLITLKSNASKFTILHEIAHAYLDHKNESLKEFDKEQKEANSLARKWLKLIEEK